MSMSIHEIKELFPLKPSLVYVFCPYLEPLGSFKFFKEMVKIAKNTIELHY